MSDIVFKGAFGKVNGKYGHSKSLDAPAVLIVENMKEKNSRKQVDFSGIADIVFDIFIENNFSALRFRLNEYSNVDKTEVENTNLLDMTAALDWLHNKNIECRSFWICGIDTSVAPVLQLVMRRPDLENYAIFSPDLRKCDLSFIIPCASSGLIVRATDDLKFTEDECIALQEKLITKSDSKVKYLSLEGSDRNFKGSIDELKVELNDYLKEKTAEDRRNFKHVTAGKRRRRKKKAMDQEEEKIIYINPIKSLDIDDI